MEKTWILLCGFVLCWAGMRPAFAADATDAKAHKARIECAAGNFQEGVRLLAELWVATGDATFIYNQGRCYEQNGEDELAVSRFREYLRKVKRIDREQSESINRHIEELQHQAKTRAAAPSTVINLVQSAPAASPGPAASPTPAPPAQAGTPPMPNRSAELVATAPPAPSEEPPYYARWWFWTGVGAVVAGGVVTAILLTHSSKASPGCDQGVSCVP